jgi:hypothetical protein
VVEKAEQAVEDAVEAMDSAVEEARQAADNVEASTGPRVPAGTGKPGARR